jgi:hypothetical protein
MIQLVQPNPSIPCKPGWCLKYVRETFGAPSVEPSATAGWENADFKHWDKNFPDAWVPLWFSLDTTPLGHVVLRSPRGIIYSTSSLANTPYVHPNLEHLMNYYAYYKMNLTYLGWSEDISNVRVVKPDTISVQSVEEEEVSAKEVVDELLSRKFARQGEGQSGEIGLDGFLAWYDANEAGQNKRIDTLTAIVEQLAVKQGVLIDYEAVGRAVVDEEARRLNN